MKKILKTVTVTGADDKTNCQDLVDIQKDFPFVEFGILMSKLSEGRVRFPTRSWIERMMKYDLPQLSGHLCGRWVRDLLEGEGTFWDDMSSVASNFHRIQLNFHALHHQVNSWEKVFQIMKDRGSNMCQEPEFIFQLDGVNDKLCSEAINAGLNVSPFFDISGGAGILVEDWPRMEGWCGYAGGLSPSNLKEQLRKISQVTEGPIWIDAETRLRTRNRTLFDIETVRRFLEEASDWVV